MPRKRRVPEDQVRPTPETLAKLQSDPWQRFLVGKDSAIERAGDEIASIYNMVVKDLLARRQPFGPRVPGRNEDDGFLAWAHAVSYMPWVAEIGPRAMDEVFTLLIDRIKYDSAERSILWALERYAKRMQTRGEFER